MATRNPMNQRYQGDGPGGQTRKSASSVKPVSEAASSVYIKKKPVTDSEKRAARKAREREASQKAKARADRQAVKAAELAAQQAEKEKAQPTPAGAGEPEKKPASKLSSFFNGFKNPAAAANMPKSEEYKKWKRVYWILLGVGIVAVAASFFLMNSAAGGYSPFLIVMLVIAYGAVIAAFVVDFKKVRPFTRRQQAQATGKKTPKVLKHEQEAAAQAAAVEAARKAAKATKKPVRHRDKDTIIPGDEQ